MSFFSRKRPGANLAPPKPKSAGRGWLDSLLFAVVVASLFRWSVAEAYYIPSESMEHSLLVGDRLVVSKLHYGPITPQTPLQVPLTHQELFGWQSYSDLVQLPTFRFPGFSTIQRNDVVGLLSCDSQYFRVNLQFSFSDVYQYLSQRSD